MAEEVSVVRARWGSWTLTLSRTPLSTQQLRTLYDGLARTWAMRRAYWGFDHAYETLLRGAVTDQGLACARVLDAGVGDGGLSLALVRALGRGVCVEAVDVSPRMLAVAQERLHEAGCEVRAHEASVEAMPLADNSVDVALVGHVLEHLADPCDALAELHRVLRPGGVLVVFATQCEVFGRLLQLRWRLRCHTQSDAASVLSLAGFSGEVMPVCGPWWTRRASLAWVARPVAVGPASASLSAALPTPSARVPGSRA